MGRDLKTTKLYRVIAKGRKNQILKVSREYFKLCKDPNIRDSDTGGNLLHHIVGHHEKFNNPEMMTVVYMLGLMDIEVDVQDYNGDTALHCVVRQKGAYRIMVALLRFGVNTSLKNSIGMTAEDILRRDKPPGYEEMLHWYCKLKPGLWCALKDEKPDRHLVEKLLKSWCRVTTVKNGKTVNLKHIVMGDIYKHSLLRMMDRYEQTNECALTLLAGQGSMVRRRLQEGSFMKVNVNTVDVTHQLRYPDYPEAPIPLVAATWETNSHDAVEAVMEMEPDTSVFYAPDKDMIPTPVIFRLLSSPYRPKELHSIHRILEYADTSLRSHTGQTLLFQAVYTEEPMSTVRLLLRKGVNVAARDYVGRTARDFAEKLKRDKYVSAIDNYVLQMIKAKDFPRVEGLLLDGYDHVKNITDKSGRTAVEIASKLSSPQVYEIVKLGDEIQRHVKRVFQAIDEGHLENVHKLLTCKKYAAGRDDCGRTPLMKAVMKGRRIIAIKLATDCGFTINMQDSLGRSVLHYAYLFMDDPEMIQLLKICGADPDQTDVRGRIPSSYSLTECGSIEYLRLQREVLDADLDIYTFRTDFECSFRLALKAADLNRVQQLVAGLAEHGSVARYSHLLFDCVDLCREDIAVFLLNSGFEPDICRRDPKCTPSTDIACSSLQCSHKSVSLRQRAMENDCSRVVKLINQLTNK